MNQLVEWKALNAIQVLNSRQSKFKMLIIKNTHWKYKSFHTYLFRQIVRDSSVVFTHYSDQLALGLTRSLLNNDHSKLEIISHYSNSRAPGGLWPLTKLYRVRCYCILKWIFVCRKFHSLNRVVQLALWLWYVIILNAIKKSITLKKSIKFILKTCI